MTDVTAANAAFNEALAEENERLNKELGDMRALLGRAVNVNVQAPEQATLKKIGDYLPQLTHISTNLSQVASAIQASNNTAVTLATRLAEQNALLQRIAEGIEAH